MESGIMADVSKRARVDFMSEPFDPFGSAMPSLQNIMQGVFSNDPTASNAIGPLDSGFSEEHGGPLRANIKLPLKCSDEGNPEADPTLQIPRGAFVMIDSRPNIPTAIGKSYFAIGNNFVSAMRESSYNGMQVAVLNYTLHMQAAQPSPDMPIGKLTVDEVAKRWRPMGVLTNDVAETNFRTSVRTVGLDVLYETHIINCVDSRVKRHDFLYLVYIAKPMNEGGTYTRNLIASRQEYVGARNEIITNPDSRAIVEPYRVQVGFCVSDMPVLDPKLLVRSIPTFHGVQVDVQGHYVRLGTFRKPGNSGTSTHGGMHQHTPAPCGKPESMNLREAWSNTRFMGLCGLVSFMVCLF